MSRSSASLIRVSFLLAVLTALLFSRGEPNLRFDALRPANEESRKPGHRSPVAPKDAAGIGVSSAWNAALPHQIASRLALGPEGLLREKDGAFHFNTRTYGATVDARTASWALPPMKDGSPRPRWEFEFQTVDVGGRSWIAGGEGKLRRQADANAVVAERGTLDEIYSFRENDLEQTFVLRDLPQSRGEIRISGQIRTNLELPADGTTGPELQFQRNGADCLRISEAVAIDAAGERIALDLEYRDGAMTIVVPGDWVARAELPITVDPLIGAAVPLDSDAWLASYVRSAYNTATQQWLVVWIETLGTMDDSNVHGRFVDANGAAVGGILNLATTALNEYMPEISYAPALNKYLLVYMARTAYTEALYRLVYARVLNADASFATGAVVVSSRPYDMYNGYGGLAAEFDGTRWYVAWRYYIGQPAAPQKGGDLEGCFVASNGTTTAVTANLDGNTLDTNQPFLRFVGGNYVLAWSEYNAVTGVSGSFARTISTTGVMGPRVSVGSGYFNGLAAGNGRLLFVRYTNQPPVTQTYGIVGQIYSNTLASLVAPFVITQDIYQTTPEGATYSAFSNTFMVTIKSHSGMDPPPVELRAHRVDLDGRTYGATVIHSSTYGTNGSTICGSAASNKVLCAYIVSGQPTVVFSQLLNTDPPAMPPAPTGLTATAKDSRVILSWAATAGATRYNIIRGENGGTLYYLASTTTPGYTDDDVVNGITYTYGLSAINSSGESGFSALASATPAAPATVPALFVVGNLTLGTGDAAVNSRLQSLGYGVTLRLASASTSADANGKAIVVISSTVAAADVNTKFRNVAIPVIGWENILYDSDYMRLTGTTAGTHYGTAATQTSANIVNASHPMAAGLTGIRTVSASSTFTWGKPLLSTGSQAVEIARLTTGDTARAAIFAFEKGAMMTGQTAPARRVGFFLGDTTAASLTTDGWKLFDAAVRWAAGVPSPTWNVAAAIGNGSITLTWEPVSGATSYQIRRATSAGGPWTTIANGVTLTNYVAGGLTNGTTYYFQVIAQNAGGDAAPVVVQAAPNPTPLKVAIKGRRTLRKFPSGGTDVGGWCEGSYEAVVRRIVRRTINGVVQDQADVVAHTSSWSIVADAHATAGCITLISPTANPCTIRATSTQGVGFVQFRGTVGTETVTAKFAVSVGERLHPSIWFRYPEEDIQANRTQRVPAGYTNADLWAGNADDTDWQARDRRIGARYKCAEPFFQPTEDTWKQGTIQPYFMIETSRGLKINQGFNGSHEFVADKQVTWNGRLVWTISDAARAVGGMGTLDYVNVYFVHGIRSDHVNSPALGIGGGPNMEKDTMMIMLADGAGPDVLAHELGHVLTLPDLQFNSPVSGSLNNLIQVILDPPPNTGVTARRYLNMWGIANNLDHLITSDELDKVRLEMEIASAKKILGFWRD
jgi:hypothetical protein